MTPRYRLENVVRRYRQLPSGRSVEVLHVPELAVQPGEILAVVGPNGSGKSTLLETLAFLQSPDEGRILLDGRDVWAAGESLAARRRCPLLLQRTVLFQTSVLRNVLYGLQVRRLAHHRALPRATQILRQLRLEGLSRRGPRQLSGGERQRVALARLLVLRPDVVLLDEPTAHVDRANAECIEEALRQLHRETNLTIVLASHDPRQVQGLAHRMITLEEGRLT